MNVNKVSNEMLQDMFSEAYREQIGIDNNISEIECVCSRDTATGSIDMEVTVFGYCGTPSISDYKTGKVKNANKVSVEIDKGKKTVFTLDKNSIKTLNTSEYVMTYKA